MVLLIDANVILDVLLNREPFVEQSRKVYDLCASKKHDAALSAHSLIQIWHGLRQKFSAEARKTILLSLLDLFDIVAGGKMTMISALERDESDDFENELLAKCAQEIHADYIITRNTDEFSASTVRAISPAELSGLP